MSRPTHEVAGMFHVFQILMPWAEESRTIYDHVASFVELVLEGAPPLDSEVLDRLQRG